MRVTVETGLSTVLALKSACVGKNAYFKRICGLRVNSSLFIYAACR